MNPTQAVLDLIKSAIGTVRAGLMVGGMVRSITHADTSEIVEGIRKRVMEGPSK